MTRPAGTGRARGDAAALATLIAIILVAVGFRFVYDDWLAQWDILGYFLPNYGYVGERIRSLQVPAWNPYFSSGTPMAGDAGGGWMYLPVMVAFALFTAATAIKVMVLLQTLIGGLATYLFARRLGLFPLAALFAAATLAVGPALYDATGQSTVIGQIAAWTPVAVVGAEGAIAATRWSARLAWSGLAGVALVQMFAAWPQGFIYGAMLTAGWFAYRGLFTSLPDGGSRRTQLGRTVMAGGETAAFAVTLGAAAILPRLEFSAESTIPNGDYSHVIGGGYVDKPMSWLGLLSVYLQSSYFWRIIELNGVILLLGLLAVFLGSNRYGIRFWVLAALLFLDLAATPSLTRGALYLIPLFKTVHSHRPTATMYMVYLPVAMLAGAGVQLVLTAPRARLAWLGRLLPMLILYLAIHAVQRAGHPVGRLQAELVLLATGLIVVAAIRLPAAWPRVRDHVPQIVAIGLLALSLVYPSAVDFRSVMAHPANTSNNLFSRNPSIQQGVRAMLSQTDPGTAAALLQFLQTTQPPFRYAAFFGTGTPGTYWQSSTAVQLKPSIVAILANARSARLGLEQISGYNPLHLQVYAQYLAVMNGTPQNYHWLDVYEAALSSQLFNMLNVRYVLMPANLAHMPPVAESWHLLYRDGLVSVYENLRAFPRAWLVHDIRRDRNGRGLTLLARGAVNGHTVAFVDGAVPPASASGQTLGAMSLSTERVVVTIDRPETMTIQATAAANGLLVLSEPYAKGWKAEVDGKAVPVVRTDDALQGVPLTAGTHAVVLHYAPRSLTLGLPVTGGGTLALLGIWLWALIDWLRRRQS